MRWFGPVHPLFATTLGHCVTALNEAQGALMCDEIDTLLARLTYVARVTRSLALRRWSCRAGQM